MSLETDIWDAVMADVALSTLIGTKLYRNRAPDDPVLPYIVVYEVRRKFEQAFDAHVVVAEPVLQYRILSADEDEAVAIRDALEHAIVASGYPATIEDSSSAGEALSSLYRRDLTARFPYAP